MAFATGTRGSAFDQGRSGELARAFCRLAWCRPSNVLDASACAGVALTPAREGLEQPHAQGGSSRAAARGADHAQRPEPCAPCVRRCARGRLDRCEPVRRAEDPEVSSRANEGSRNDPRSGRAAAIDPRAGGHAGAVPRSVCAGGGHSSGRAVGVADRGFRSGAGLDQRAPWRSDACASAAGCSVHGDRRSVFPPDEEREAADDRASSACGGGVARVVRAPWSLRAEESSRADLPSSGRSSETQGARVPCVVARRRGGRSSGALARSPALVRDVASRGRVDGGVVERARPGVPRSRVDRHNGALHAARRGAPESHGAATRGGE